MKSGAGIQRGAEDEALKKGVRDFWEAAACGEVYAIGPDDRQRYQVQYAERYRLEPYIEELAGFEDASGREVLEIGVGMGADHLRWARSAPARLVGVDLTRRGATLTRDRLGLEGLHATVLVADAETLPLASESFDVVYSWGVLHHSPATGRAIAEVHRVVRPGGRALVMIYHSRSVLGFVLWLRYGLLRLRPRTSLHDIYATYLESPGTKAYSVAEARELFARFSDVSIVTRMSPGDLLEGAAGQRHGGPLLRIARRLWPRWLLRRMPSLGTYLVVSARK